ncbi:NmrA family NAD(P)-binding protein [Chitinophaga flava]|uniref:NAD-dependent dehydratase n=1 Tax=Chitinophaga flava TaxID=2259036 RepID=A0A365Y0C0_9BACT|nr:NmrA family NAD(P)-binding protein [Chitinophaga flava]RBL92037.1 NAD-dependent dehydratase [Chitinophaga flava]
MKIIVTGSLGNISKPLTKQLIEKGHDVTVISSNGKKQDEITSLGATAAIGQLEDVNFLVNTFTGADAVYCMTPSNFAENDLIAYYRKIGKNYAQAIGTTGVKRVVLLSSFGAHLNKGTGIILGSHYVEQMLNELPDVAVTHMRPAAFYYNLHTFAGMIKKMGFMAANYGGTDKVLWVSPADIAEAVAEEIIRPHGPKIRYIASDERSCNEVAAILGKAIGQPHLQWNIIPGEQMQTGLEANGVPPLIASLLVELNAALHSGILAEDYYQNPPAVMGKVKLEDFAAEFAAAFNTNN